MATTTHFQALPAMPSIPLPFVVALVLAVMLVRLVRAHHNAPPNLFFVALLVACAVQSVLVGLRWNAGFAFARYLLPVIAAAIPPLVFASFDSLAVTRRFRTNVWIIAAPPVVVVLLIAMWPEAVDITLIVIYFGFAAALLLLARQGPDALPLARFESVAYAHRALLAGAAVLVASAFVDLFVMADFTWMGGRHAAIAIAAANLVNPLILGLAAAVSGHSRVPDETTGARPSISAVDDPDVHDIVRRLETLLREQHLYRDANLNLNRLARRAGIPARRASVAVNRAHGKNVSQFINGYRIDEARRLLRQTSEPVTRIMFEAGFQTKSNFNREFRRVTGMNPQSWRAQNAAEK
jgi:AraC-like DNA-binding protein